MKSVRRLAQAVRNRVPWGPIAFALLLVLPPAPAATRPLPGAEQSELIQPNGDATLDSPRALPNYRARGFREMKTEMISIDVPDGAD